MPDVTIPVLGRPLAGKSTFIRHAARAFSGTVRSDRCSLPENWGMGFLARGTFEHRSREIELWCMPAGSAPEWQARLATQAGAAVLLVEPQRAAFSHQATFLEAFSSLACKWFVVVGKQDLTRLIEPVATFLPRRYLSCPRLQYSGLAPQAQSQVGGFLTDVILPSVENGAYNLDDAIDATHADGDDAS